MSARRILLGTTALMLFASSALAADNATLITPCAAGCVTVRAVDIGGGVQSQVVILGSTAGASIYGIAGTANANVLSVQGIASGTALPITGTVTAVTAITNALPSGTNVIGHVIADTGSTTAVTQATAGNLNATVVGTGTFAVQAAATLGAETTKVIGTVRNLGNGGGVLDAVVGAAYPANALAVGVLNGSNIGRLVGDETSGLWVNIKAGAGSGGTALADAGTFTLTSTNMTPAGCTFNSGSLTLTTGTAGALSCTAGRSLHTTVDTVTNWAGGALGAMANYGTSPGAVLVPGVNAFVTNATALGQAAMAASSPVVIANNQSTLPVNTAQVNGVTVLTGTGATGTGAQRVTVSTDQATNAGAALVKGGVGVVNGGSFRQEVDASATATVLQQSTGAAGDYLSHCVIFPATTTPGVVQVFDNTNAGGNYAINFPGGASSVSNLAPIPIPIGAVSVAGAWKVTTTTNVSVVCYGRFS